MSSAQDTLIYWIKERYSILQKKNAGKSRPWTDDPILNEYRFCNVFREDDRETIWIHNNWLKPHEGDPDVWFAMAVARFINWSPTLEAIGYPVPWKPAKVARELVRLKARGEKVFTGAYIVSTNGNKMDKDDYVVNKVLTPLWNNRAKIRPAPLDTLAKLHAKLLSQDGVGSFMAAQIVADVKWAGQLKSASGWTTWAASGPGSRRGLNRIYGRPVDAPWKEEEWLQCIRSIHKDIYFIVKKITGREIDLQNLQNCLCEFDKYMRVKNGEGRPRSRYVPA